MRKRYLKYIYIKYIKDIRYINLKNSYRNISKSEKKLFLFCTPTHGNLGDQAILVAELEFLHKNFPEYKIFEIPTELVKSRIRSIKKIINSTDLIMIHGGGNLGDRFLNEEMAHQLVIKYFRKFPIIFFPQSATFENNKDMIYTNPTSSSIYQKHNRLTIVARESRSLSGFENIFPSNEVIYVPDIVLSLKVCNQKLRREGLMIIMRNDGEKVVSDDTLSDINTWAESEFKMIRKTDTVVEYKIYEETRLEELQKLWDKYKSSELVITDRLHGMIFAYLTDTPCIVFDNFNSKIKKTYDDWLSNIKNIYFVDASKKIDVNTLTALFEEIRCEKTSSINIEEMYNPLIKAIERAINGENI